MASDCSVKLEKSQHIIKLYLRRNFKNGLPYCNVWYLIKSHAEHLTIVVHYFQGNTNCFVCCTGSAWCYRQGAAKTCAGKVEQEIHASSYCLSIQMAVQLHPLHQRRDLTDECIDVINSEWPRSKAMRYCTSFIK